MARKKSTRKLSETRKAYNKERSRIQRQISRMRKRGYFGMEDMLPPIPKKVTQGSVRRLKKITTKDLYDKADFVDITTGDIIGTGAEGRKIERKRSAEKAKQTRARHEHDKFMIEQGRRQRELTLPDTEDEQVYQEDMARQAEDEEYLDLLKRNREEMEQRWRQQREQADAENRRRMTEDEEYRRQFQAGTLMQNRVRDLLESMRLEWPNTVSEIERIISDAESFEGEEVFWDRMSEQSELISDLQQVFYKSGDHIRPTQFNKIKEAIMNRPMSASEAFHSQEMYEKDQYHAFDIDEGIED